MILPKELKGAFKPRPRDADKHSVGTVAIVGGSASFSSAPAIAGLGARAAGSGLVRLVVPDETRCAAALLVPEATYERLSPSVLPPRADVTVVGMGLGAGCDAQALVLQLLSGGRGRFVLDADALTILAGRYGMVDGYRPQPGQELVLTPHEGEAARLLGWTREAVSADRPSAARAIVRRYGATVVLKGPGTLVVSEDGSRFYENSTGNPFMALGGMGDLLAGALGARWAYLQADAFLAAASAVWLHGAAADRIVAEGGDMSLTHVATELGAMRVVLDGDDGKPSDQLTQPQK